MLGAKLEDLKLKDKKFNHHGAKEAVFPFDKFPKVDPVLGPEMRSTGEVLGLSDDYALLITRARKLPVPSSRPKALCSSAFLTR